MQQPLQWRMRFAAAPYTCRCRSSGAAAVVAAAGATGRVSGTAIPELDLKKLYTDASYIPERTIGPVEVQVPPGKTRRVVAKREVPMGGLLFVSEPVGSVARGLPGSALLPPELFDHLKGQRLTDADVYKLAMLYDGTPASQQRQTSFRDFEDAKAATKAGKAKAATKGFGGGGGGKQQAAAAAQQQQAPLQQQRVSVELSDDRFESIVSYNAFGAEVADIAAAPARGEGISSYIGIWPEFSLLNHSCIPNSTVTFVAERLVVRAASRVPKGAQITTSYLDARGGVPLVDRRRALQVAYGFKCACTRCKLEESMPEELQRQIERLHALATPGNGGPFDGLPAAADAKDAAALSSALAAAKSELRRLDGLLAAAGVAPGSLEQAALCAGAAGFFLNYQRAKVAAAAAAGDAEHDGSVMRSEEEEREEVDPAELLDLVEVLRVYQPGGPALLATAADALQYATGKYGTASGQASAALQMFLKMLLVKYGEVQSRPVLERLVDAITRASPRLAALGLDGGFALVAAEDKPSVVGGGSAAL